MAFVVSNEGEAFLAANLVAKTSNANWKLKLFTNNVTPGETDTVATYTEMGAVQGYTAKTLAGASWNAAVAGTGTGTSDSNRASIDYPQQTFTADGTGGAQNVYGYFITDSAGTTLIGAERAPTPPQAFTTAGDLIKITPKLKLGTM